MAGNSILVINAAGAETRVALVENGTIHEYYLERKREKGIVGNIYKGRVVRVLPGMQAAFVDIGLEKAAFLYVGDVYGDPDFSEEFELTEGEHPTEVNEVPDEEEATEAEARAQAQPVAPPGAEGAPAEAAARRGGRARRRGGAARRDRSRGAASCAAHRDPAHERDRDGARAGHPRPAGAAPRRRGPRAGGRGRGRGRSGRRGVARGARAHAAPRHHAAPRDAHARAGRAGGREARAGGARLGPPRGARPRRGARGEG